MTEYEESTQLAAELAMESVEGGHQQSPWHRVAAITTLVFAVLAAVAALLAGVTSEEILADRTNEIMDSATAQNDVLRAEIMRTRHEFLRLSGEPVPADEVALLEALDADAADEEAATTEIEDELDTLGHGHLVFALAATIFAVSIAITGLAVITDRKWMWAAGGVMGLFAAGVLVTAISGIAW